MATILLRLDDKNIRHTEVSKILVRLLYGVHDLETALVRFDTIYSGELEKTHEIMAEFDAHVGDCGCHLRAQMLWDLTEHYRDAKRREWIGHTVKILRDIKKKIVVLYSDIRRVNGNIRLLGFSSPTPLFDLFDRIGCKPLFTILDDYSSKTDGSDKFTDSTPSDHGIISYSDSIVEERSRTHSTACNRHRIVKINKWNLSDYRMLARFLSYCRLLSLGKTVTLEPSSNRIYSRLDPVFASSETERQLDCIKLIESDLLSKFIAHHDRPSRTALVHDIENMQIYIAQLTCDWIMKLCLEMGLGQPTQR
jgi:hypothetical protein